MLDLAAARYDAVRHAESYPLPGVSPLAVSRDNPFQAEKVVLSWYGVPPPIAVSHSVRHPPLRSFKAPARSLQRFLRGLSDDAEYLPIPFQSQVMVVQPSVHKVAQLFQLPLVRPSGRQVVHVPHIMGAKPALPDKLVQRLQDRVCKPLGRVCPNQNTVLDDSPYQVQHPPVLEELAHTGHDHLRLQTVVEVIHIS